MSDNTVLITGVCGFIGYHVAKNYLDAGWKVVGIDDVNNYYDQKLKYARKARLEDTRKGKFEFMRWTICDRINLSCMINHHKPRLVIHLAAQAGVRWSVENPRAYVDANVLGHLSVLEACAATDVEHLVYASSSSVYGNREAPASGFPESCADYNVESPYAATKVAAEVMSIAFSKLHPHLRQTGLRFFTVYGPWGRPDMAYYSFTERMLREEPLRLFNHGKVSRDFTYVDDVVKGITQIAHVAQLKGVNHEIFNIGNHEPEFVDDLVDCLEMAHGIKAIREYVEMQPGDVTTTFADTTLLQDRIGWVPSTPLCEGINNFAKWHRDYRGS